MRLWSELLGTEQVGSYIAGEVVPGSGEPVELVDPTTEETYAVFGDGGAGAVAAATAQKTARQPANELTRAPRGTAATVAPATPTLTTDIARPSLSAGTR